MNNVNQITQKKKLNHFVPDYRKVMQHLEEKRFALPDWVVQEHTLTVNIPKRFSISEQPDETIHLLRLLYTIGKYDQVKRIIFNHSKCEFLGLSASTIMDVILLVMIDYRNERNKKLSLFGKVPKNQTAKDILLASGLPFHINADHKPEYNKENVVILKTISGECKEESRQSGRVATTLTEYFNRCLTHQNMQLTEDGLQLLSTLLGEVLNNCEIHGGRNATWYTQGHYEDSSNQTYGELQLLFLTLGDTVYEGLLNKSSKETQQRLHHFHQKHKPYFSSNWTAEIAYTVFALQEGISRLRDQNISGYEGRGTGTVSFIETLHLIGKRADGQLPEMTIISGKTYIKFDSRHKMQTINFNNDPAFGNGKKSIIAFNVDNDIYQPADHTNVRQLKENFPGTIISIRMYLDKRYIEKNKENDYD